MGPGKALVWNPANQSLTDPTGSIANITSASTVAVSSFSMTLQDPQPIIDRIDVSEYDKMRAYWKDEVMPPPEFSDPHPPPFAKDKISEQALTQA